MAGQRRRQSGGDRGGRPRRGGARPLRRILRGAAAGALALSTLAACGESGITGPDTEPRQWARGDGPGATAPTLDTQLLGTWSRAVFFVGPDGFLHSSETRWTFDATGRVTRRSIVTNFTLGFLEEMVAVGQWRTDGALLTVTWLSPVQDTFVSEYRVDATLQGARLILGQQSFQRAAPW